MGRERPSARVVNAVGDSVDPMLADRRTAGAIVRNSLTTVSTQYGSTGFRAAHTSARGAGVSALAIANEFLLNSQYRRRDRQFQTSVESYFLDDAQVMLSLNGLRSDPRRAIALPQSLPLNVPLGALLQRRRSRRDFTAEPFSLEQIGTLLRAGDGVSGYGNVELMTGGNLSIPFRTAPSGGGLFPITLLVAAFRTAGLEPGLYAFEPRSNVLRPLHGKECLPGIQAAFGDLAEDSTVSRAAIGILFKAEVVRSTQKYGARGVRFVLQECGYIAQNIHLACGALGVGSVDWGGFLDQELHGILGLDGTNNMIAHTVLAGVV